MPDQSIPSYSITANGSPLAASVKVLSIRVEKELNRIARAQVVIRDGSSAEGDFPLSDGEDLIPGKTIVIQAGYEQKNATIFSGIVVGHRLEADGQSSPRIVLECRDQAIKMTVGRNSAYYTETTDSDIISTLVSNAGLSAEVDSCSYSWPEVIQYFATDWDFLMSRAEMNGLVVWTDQGKVYAKTPSSGSSVATYTFGSNLFAFDTNLDGLSQLKEVQAGSWDYGGQSWSTEQGSDPSLPSQGDLSGSELASATAPGTVNLTTTTPLASGALTDWASAQLLKSRLAMIRCSLKVRGDNSVKPGDTVTLAKVGKHFNGDAYVSGVVHEIGDGMFKTTVRTGLDDQWYADWVETTYRPAAGQLPGVRGLVNATVQDISSDSDADGNSEFRVKVTFPTITASTDGVWARLANFYSTSGAGVFFYPEVGDEVIVGFLNEDPRYPVILGSVYSSSRAPAYTPDEDNSTKAILTVGNSKVEFDDKNKVITITTESANQIVLSDQDTKILVQDQNENKVTLDDQGISLEDKNSNKITMDSSGITLQDSNSNKISLSSSGITVSSQSDVDISGTGSVTVSGTGGVTVSSDADVSITATASLSASGLQAEISADVQAEISGPIISISADGELELQGGMVMIN